MQEFWNKHLQHVCLPGQAAGESDTKWGLTIMKTLFLGLCIRLYSSMVREMYM